MLSWFLPPARLIVRGLVANDGPRQLAWGVALGVALGLVPKGNLTALLLAIALFSFKFNLAAGLASAFVFSWVGMLLDPLAHRLGWQILSYQPLQPLFAWCYELPLVPWSGLNNTVVAGQLVLGLYAMVPMYWLVLRTDACWRDAVIRWLDQHQVACWLLRAENVPFGERDLQGAGE